jgi:hypothetical protein
LSKTISLRYYTTRRPKQLLIFASNIDRIARSYLCLFDVDLDSFYFDIQAEYFDARNTHDRRYHVKYQFNVPALKEYKSIEKMRITM